MHKKYIIKKELEQTSVKEQIEYETMRKGAGEGVLNAGESDKNVVVLTADLEESTFMHLFAKKYPERFYDVGIAEQNLASVGSGMAAMGKIPFISSYSIFNPGRNWEQIRTTICYNNQPVKIIGSHAGITVGPDGGSHQMLEDIALMRTIPNMTVFSPCDYHEARRIVMAVSKMREPAYIRLTRGKTPVITSLSTPFEVGKAYEVFNSVDNDGDGEAKDVKADVGIIATGHLVYEAIKAGEILEKNKANKIKVKVYNFPTIKPIDEETIISLAYECRALVTVEEHQMAGGLGSLVAEITSTHYPVPIEFIGVKDSFGQSGTAEELLEFYGLTRKHIAKAVEKVVLRKI